MGSKCTRTAQFVLAQIKNSFTCLEPEIIRPLYLALVRPHLEYAVSAWNPSLIQDKNKLEKIQRRTTKLCPKLKKKSYPERLKFFDLTTLETRRKRGDLIQFYKFVHGLEDIKWVNELRHLNMDGYTGPTLRRHKYHFYRESKACSAREEYFVNRVIPLWNGLPEDVVDATSLDSFKARLDRLSTFSVNGCHGSN